MRTGKSLGGGVSKKQIDHNSGKAMSVQGDTRGKRDFYYAFTNNDFLTATQWKTEFDFAMAPGNGSDSRIYLYSEATGASYGLFKSTNKLFQISIPQWGTTANVYANNDEATSLETFTVDSYNGTLNTWYHAVICGNKTAGAVTLTIYDSANKPILSEQKVCDFTNPKGISIQAAKGLGQVGIDDIKCYATLEKTIKPTASMTKVENEKRIISFTQINGNDIYYYQTGNDYSTDGLTATKYTGPISIAENSYFVIYAQKDQQKSDTAHYYFEAGSEITLNTPTIQRTADRILSINSNQSNILLKPSATVTVTFPDGTQKETTSITDAPYGKYTVTAEAEGYISASTTIDIDAAYSFEEGQLAWSYDFTKYLGQTWQKIDENSYKFNAYTMYNGKWGNGENINVNILFGNDNWLCRTNEGGLRNQGNGNRPLGIIVEPGQIVVFNMSNVNNGDMFAGDNALYQANKQIYKQFAFEYTGTKHGTLYAFLPKQYTNIASIEVYNPKTQAITISAAEYATFASAYNTVVPDNDVKVYTVKSNNNSITINKIETGTIIPTGTGLLLNGNAGNYDFEVTTTEGATLADNDLKAATEDVTATGVQYALAVLSSGKVGFAKVQAGETIPAGKAYLEVSEENAKNSFFAIGEETTSIKDVNTENNTDNNFYTLQGVKIAKPVKGLYINNGKKVIVK